MELCLLEGKQGVRGKKFINSDGNEVDMFAVYDSVNIICDKDIKSQYGHHLYYTLIQEGSEYKDEVCLLLSSNLKFPERGRCDTPYMTK